MFDPIYVKTSMGLWVRAQVEGDQIVISVQERWEQQGALVIAMGPNGEECWRKPIYQVTGGAAWLEQGSIALDDRWEVLEIPALAWPIVVHGIQRHVTGLIANGWGDTIMDVVEWFAEPTKLRWLAPKQIYEVVCDYEPLVGFVGMFFEIEEKYLEDEEQRWIRFLGVDMPLITINDTTWIAALLVATHPVVEG